MREDAASLLENAEVFRQRAARARRLASAATAPDVAEALRTYATHLDEQARELEERAAALIKDAPHISTGGTQRLADEPPVKSQDGETTKPR